jgi:hypothetical protein
VTGPRWAPVDDDTADLLDICRPCDLEDHANCTGTLWSPQTDSPAVCECDPDNHEQDPLS